MSQHAQLEDPLREIHTAVTGPLYAVPFKFPTLWNRAENICLMILSWDKSTAFRGQKAIALIVEGYTLIYRLVSTRCVDCPALVRGVTEPQPVIGTEDEGTQALVVYYLLRETLRKQLLNVVHVALVDAVAEEPPKLLRTYVMEWNAYGVGINNLRVMFSYLHGPWQKHGLPMEHPLLPTEVLAILQWSEAALDSDLWAALSTQLFHYIELDRRQPLDQEMADLVRYVAYSVSALTDSRRLFYGSVIEERYIAYLGDYCSSSVNRFKKSGVFSYINACLDSFDEEESRVNRLLVKSSLGPVLRKLTDILIDGELEYLKQPISEWVFTNDETCLSKLFILLSKSSEGMVMLRETYKSCASEKGQSEVERVCKSSPQPSNNYRVILQAVISVYSFFEKQQSAFNNNPFIKESMVNGLAEILKSTSNIKNSTLLSEELTYYAHDEMKRIMSDGDVPRTISNIVTLFQLLPSKKGFFEAYPRLLGIRLLSQTCDTSCEEKVIDSISELKDSTCDFLHRCKVMLYDATTELSELRNEYNAQGLPKDFVLFPFFLTSYSWKDIPLNKPTLPVPFVLRSPLESFQMFYKKMRPKQIATFAYALCHGVVRMNLHRSGTVQYLDIHMNQDQLFIAELFNRHAEWRYGSILNILGSSTSSSLFFDALKSFVKEGILEVDGEWNSDEALNLATCIRITRSPSMKKKRISLFSFEKSATHQISGVFPLTEEVEHVDAIHTNAEPLNSSAIQAVIVRALKTDGTLSFSDILEKVRDEAPKYYVPLPTDIKGALEFLIGRGFIVREDGSGNFTYLS